MVDMIDTPSIEDYINPMDNEVEDPPEPFKTPMTLLNERNPLHQLEEKLDSKHMLTHSNFGLYYFSSNEYWNFEIPFQEDIIETEKKVEYNPNYKALIYLPDIESEESDETPISYSTTFTHDEKDDILVESNSDFEGGTDETLHDTDEIIIADVKIALEIELLIHKLINKENSIV